MSHTPGPYKIITADLGDDFACIVPVEIHAANGTVVSQSGGLAPDNEEWRSEELFANAHLLAAAPEMLEALEWLAEEFDRRDLGDGAMLYDSDIEQVKAVIRKARGEA